MTKKDTGIVDIRGKAYQTVALRVSMFRERHPEYSLITEVLHRDVDCVVMQARIADPSGRVIATGHAEEYRKATSINKTSALENAETSAIGRALAALGLGGTEFASADEVARAVSGQKGEARFASPVQSAMEGVEVDGEVAAKVASTLVDLHTLVEQGTDTADKAFEEWDVLDNDMKLAVWRELAQHSKVRSWMKLVNDARKQAA